MKKLFLGMIIGAALASAVFYFINQREENEQKENLKAFLEMAKQKQASNQQATETLNDPSSSLVLGSALTIVIVANDVFYYFRNNDCSKMDKADLTGITDLLKQEKQQQKEKDLMIIIKTAAGSTFRNSIDLLDAITMAGIPSGHFAEVDLSEKEKYCIQHYKKD